MAEPAILLDQVSLCYRLAKQRIPSIKEYAIHWMKGALAYEKLWALNEVSLSVARGERVGIIGRNGAGKSTLLKVISGVLKPSRGRVVTLGSVAPILELGTGFDMELTGVENVYLNALLLGRSRREIDQRLDGIVEFSGLGDFIRSPIRNYSSGMIGRLGFAIATAWEPDILILDEIFSVGDAAFVRQCERRLASFDRDRTAVLLVSHNPTNILDTCQRCVWLEAGRVREDGDPERVLGRYEAEAAGEEPTPDADAPGPRVRAGGGRRRKRKTTRRRRQK
jgi:homopolymeric O-antigen transport system ATP-binding protein